MDLKIEIGVENDSRKIIDVSKSIGGSLGHIKYDFWSNQPSWWIIIYMDRYIPTGFYVKYNECQCTAWGVKGINPALTLLWNAKKKCDLYVVPNHTHNHTDHTPSLPHPSYYLLLARRVCSKNVTRASQRFNTT